MPYFPVDDNMAFHPKILSAGNEAVGLWTRAGALCKKHTTGGFVTVETARALGPQKIANRLVSAGLWVEDVDPVFGPGYRFHDWKKQAGNDDAATEKERAEKAKERNAKRQRDYRERNGESNGVSNAPVTGTPSPSPSPKDLTDSNARQSPPIDGAVRTDADIPEMTRRLAGQAGFDLPKIIAQVAKHTDRVIDGNTAYQLAMSLTGKAKKYPDKPTAYVLRSISLSPFEVQQFIDEQVA